MRKLLYSLALVTSVILVSAADMDTIYEWKYIDYDWESENSKQKAVDSGDYNYTRLMPMDVEKAKDGRVFMSMLGRTGVPASLVTITNKKGRNSGPLVKPYPDWSYFKKGDCNSIQNVYRIAIDKCERLWVLDAGYLHGSAEENNPICEPQLLSFDLKTNKLIKRTKIPKSYLVGPNKTSLFCTPIVEANGDRCEDTTVYMADAYGSQLVIWNNRRGISRLQNSVFEPSKDAVDITSGNHTSEGWEVGIVGMDISPKLLPDEERFLYFHALASFDFHGASLPALKRSIDGKDVKFISAKNFLPSQAVGSTFSSKGTFFVGLTKESGIACWNKYREFKRENVDIVIKDNVRLRYIGGMKAFPLPNSDDEELWAVSNRLVTYVTNNMDFNDYNFRILKGSVNKLIAGTKCELPREIQNKLGQVGGKESNEEENNGAEVVSSEYSDFNPDELYNDEYLNLAKELSDEEIFNSDVEWSDEGSSSSTGGLSDDGD